MIKIDINTVFIKLGQVLKLMGLITNGAEAKTFLANNDINVNGIKENRRGKKLYHSDQIMINKIVYVINDVNKNVC